jgi:branched-chain amino acid aminotransferase
MKREAIAPYYILDHEFRSTSDMEIFDRIGGGAVYEVIKMIEGVPIFFEAHMERMRRSAAALGVSIHKKDPQILEEIRMLSTQNQLEAANVKLVRSEAGGRELFLTYFIASEDPGPQAHTQGVPVILFHGERETPHIKTLKGSFRYPASKNMEKYGAYEALLVNSAGYITEGSRSNIFFLKDEGSVCTPPAKAVLPGVTRGHVLRICQDRGIPMFEQPLHQTELHQIKGIFITGTTVDVVPVSAIDGTAIPSCSVSLIQAIVGEYQNTVRAYIQQHREEG